MHAAPKPKRSRKSKSTQLISLQGRVVFLLRLAELLEEMERYLWELAPESDPRLRLEPTFGPKEPVQLEADGARELLHEALLLMADKDVDGVRKQLDAAHAELAAVFTRLLSRAAGPAN
jgi:hypothetical protein